MPVKSAASSQNKWWFKGKPLAKKKKAAQPPEEDDTASSAGSERDELNSDRAESVDRQPPKKKVRWTGADEEKSESQHPTTERETPDDEEETISEKVCMAAWNHNQTGSAYYDPAKRTIFVFEDTEEGNHFDLTKLIIEKASPEVILTSSRCNDDFMDVLQNAMEESGGLFQIRPHKDFSPAKGRDRLLSIPLLYELAYDYETRHHHPSSDREEPRSAYDYMRARKEHVGDPIMMRWNASIRLANYAALDSTPLCLASIGALLDHMARVRAVTDLEDQGIAGLDIVGIEAVTLDQVMQINADALTSLQVFESEDHASTHSNRKKEGNSLFAILNNTKTYLGMSLLRQWLLHPSFSIPTITARHDAVDCFLQPENMSTAGGMHNHLKGIHNIPRVLHSMKAGRASLIQWQNLFKFTFHTAMLRESLAELNHGGHVEIIQKLQSALDITGFKEIGTATNDTIDWEESVNAGRVSVRPHIDEALDNRKHIYHGLDSVLSEVAKQICLTVPEGYATSLNVVYFPQLGFLISIPMREEWRSVSGIQTIDDWAFQFSSDNNVFFKSPEMRDMDTHIGDLHTAIVDREIEIIQDLADQVTKHEAAILSACDVCAELDCLLSFAEASNAYEYRRPTMTEDNIIDITQGRHPLQEQMVDVFVANDTFVVGGRGLDVVHRGGKEQKSVAVCTGANACGKSVYLKQIALIQIMAQIGCFVPAASATLGVVDKLFTRVQTRETVSKAQSAFMIDLNQVSLALRNSTPRSLIILDEFGKGTLSSDGAGLFCGVIGHFLRRGPNCPKVLCATHFHDVFVPSQDLFESSLMPYISFLHMEVIITDSKGEAVDTKARKSDVGDGAEAEETIARPRESITYLYRVAQGLSHDSHAAMCAELFGVPRRLVERARFVSHLHLAHDFRPLLDEEMTPTEKDELKEAENICRRFLEWNMNETATSDADPRVRLARILGREIERD